MKIISGQLGGRRLKTARGEGMRPAMEKTREALFSMLEARGMLWPEARVLDLFAGSGSLAFECLSRGAAFAAVVENAAQVCRTLAQNINDLALNGKCRIFHQDVPRFLKSPQYGAFNLVFIDPPYHRNLLEPALRLLVSGGWLAPSAFVAAELEQGLSCPIPEALRPVAQRNFGQTSLHIWQAGGAAEFAESLSAD